MLYSVLVAIDVLLAIGIIGLVLIQQGKGADVGAAFGSGTSGTVFGARGSASFMTHATAILVTLFFINSLALAYLASHQPEIESVIKSSDNVEVVPSVESLPDVEEEIDAPQEELETSDLPDVEPMESDNAEMIESDNGDSIEGSTVTTPDDIPE